MTDKELRKLSRLELLELLLESSKENKKLKEEIERLEAENKTTENIENLSEITGRVENALEYVNNLAYALKTTLSETVSSGSRVKTERKTSVRTDPTADSEIYRRMLSFFANNDDKLRVFPADIENDVRARINSIFEKRKSN